MASRTPSPVLVAVAALLWLPVACDEGTEDATTTATQSTSNGGTGGAGAGGAGAGGAMGGSGGGDGGGMGGTGGSSTQCFSLSIPTVDVPDAIPDAFEANTPTWMRPTGEQCPATGLGGEAVPFTTYCYENDTGAPASFLFEIIVDDDNLDPAIVVYDGETIPADATQCAAVSAELVIDSAETLYTVPAGGKVTIVPTLQQPGTGTFTVVVGPDA